MIRLRLWVLERKSTKGKCSFHHIISRIHTINIIYVVTFSLDIFQNDYVYSIAAQNTKGFFSNIHRDDLVGFLEIKLMKVWLPTPAKTGPPRVFTFQMVPIQPPAIRESYH